MAKDIAKITLLCMGAIISLVFFLFALDGFIDVINDPSSCESQAKTLAELWRC